MTKEIIIDGVDVAGCEQRFGDDKCALLDQYFCENNPDCFYKQLKRLEQENKELKENNVELQIISDEIDRISGEYKLDADKYKRTLQEIKAIAEQCMNKDVCYDCEYFDDCYIEDAELPTYDICKLLIQKITKAEEE